jgi:hypothetical protein
VAYLGIVGGKSEEDTVERVLSAAVGTEVARLFNWNGMKGKRAFRNLQMRNIIYGWSAADVISFRTLKLEAVYDVARINGGI